MRPHKERETSEALYREAFAVVGYDLTEADGLPDKLIVDAERRIGCRVPCALREFYRLAGNANASSTTMTTSFFPTSGRSKAGNLYSWLRTN
jgi:hypothetical protein